MIQPLLRLALEPVAARHRLYRLFISLAAAWAALALIGLGLWWSGKTNVFVPALLSIAAGLAYWILRKRAEAWEPDWQSVARKVEQGHPDLHALLLTAVEQRPDPATGEFHFLQHRVIQSAVTESRRRPWINAVPRRKLWGAVVVQFLLLAAFVAVLVKIEGGAWRSMRERKNAAKAMIADDVTVSPGDTELERGSGLVVLATFAGNIPGDATLVFQPVNGPEQRLPLTRNLDDPVFGGGLPEVDTDLTYRVEHSGRSTRSYQVRVFEHPRLERADANVRFPEYTKLPEKQIADTRRVSAVEGSKLNISLALNKPVTSAKLVGKNGAAVPLKTNPTKAVAHLEDFDLRASDTYTLQLEDADGRTSKVPAQFTFEALPNRRPELKLASPRGDQRVSPLQEVAFQEEAWDDFGLVSYGLSYTVAGGETKELVLGRDVAADQKVQGAHLLKLEELKAEPDQLVSWYVWAEDIGPDGKPRRTASDMFFAEVRPFEEIYRAGQGGGDQQQQQQGQQGGAGGAATKLAEIQKQVITATWNLRRSEDANGGATPSEKYRKDEPVVRDSQKEALKQAEKLKDKADQPRSQALAENVLRHMRTAAEHLDKAAEATAPLPDALQAEQAAYNALLKLAAHEFNVIKSRSSQGGGQQNGDRQQQLDQLELKEEKQRYETKREATPQQNEQQREQLTILNRLKELAQRQQDINERLKELQTALEEAKTEQQKEEIRRQLKRLREEEQQLLADMDETRQKMDSSANASQFSQERRQMDDTRSEAQKAAEAMERQDASSALASGTRTQRDLQQMRDDFRNKTSGQFRDELRDLRSNARELAENQQKLSEQLAEAGKENQTPTRRSLDGSSPREQMAERFGAQQEQLKDVQERMQQLSEQAEAAEPLLARELYDSLRKTTQAGTRETLERAELLTRQGFAPQARQFEEKARQEIEDLKSGVERAAESVLGNEAEALRLAQAEIDTLSQQVERELAQANPKGAPANSGQKPGEQSGDQQSQGQQPQGRQGAGDPSAENKEGQPGASERNNESQQEGQTAQNQSDQRNGRGNRQNGQPADGQPQTAQAGQSGQPSQPGDQQGKGNPSGSESQNQEGQKELASNSNSRQGNGSQRGQQPGGQQSGDQQSDGQQPGNPQSEGEQPSGQQASAQQGQQSGGRQQGSQQRSGSRTASNSGGNSNSDASQSSQPDDPNQTGERLRELASAPPRQRGGIREGGPDGGGAEGGGTEFSEGPIRGEGFVQWSDRLRNVEEMLDDPKLRTEVARVREAARGIRAEAKRHSKEPKWDVVRSQIKEPLAELRNRVTEELARRESKESLVPIDRDPVPTQFVEHVRRYYEELGRSR